MRKDLLTDTMQPKKELVRIVIDKEKNVSVDPTGKKAGRGAYVSLDPTKIKVAKEKHILRIFPGSEMKTGKREWIRKRKRFFKTAKKHDGQKRL